MLATLNVVVLLAWLLAEIVPAAADHMAGLEAVLRRGKDREP
ncbi:MAG: hypothetical protein U1E42_09985 [Rhodospirillales bacterium]